MLDSMHRCVSLLAFFTFVVFVGCGRTPAFERAVIVTYDTLRADHLGSYGYPRPTSPFWDRLAAEGVRFERAVAPMATTVPSHASLFTGLYPLEHGVRKNDHFLDDQFITLAEIAGTQGMRTAAVSATHHLWRANVGQGFDRLKTSDERRKAPYLRADKVVDHAIEWLDDVHADERFLLWVHLFDVHMPWQPPARYRRLVRRHTTVSRPELTRFFLDRQHVSSQFYSRGDRDLLDTMDRYDGEIRFADEEIARLFDAAEERGLTKNAVWILTSDHGEGLGNHDWIGHGKHIYNEQLRVPLVIWSSDSRWGSHTVPNVVELSDLFPTLLELLGLPTPDVSRQPRSLVTLLARADGFPDGRAFSQRRHFDDASREPGRDGGNFESGRRFALQDRRYKYMLWTDGENELYDLERDPYETTNLIEREPAVASEMRAEIDQRIRTYRVATPQAVADPDALEELRALGYLQ